jgi:hypothetical protein
MLGLFRGAIGPLLRSIAPSAIGWGINRLFDSIWGQTYLPPGLKPILNQGS